MGDSSPFRGWQLRNNTELPPLQMVWNRKGFKLHFAPPSGHWCVCQRTLGGADGHLLFHRFPIYHNVVVFGNSLEN